MFLSWTRGSHEPPRHTEVDAESCRNEPIRVQESGNDLGTIAPKHQGKRGGRGRPENRTNQKDRRPGPCLQNLHPRFKSGRRLQFTVQIRSFVPVPHKQTPCNWTTVDDKSGTREAIRWRKTLILNDLGVR
jgi:hypothetical protein